MGSRAGTGPLCAQLPILKEPPCAANPHATKFNLHILAAVAEFERDAISKRTKEALAAAKARGQQLGDPEIGQRSRVAADAHAETLRAIVTPLAGRTTRAIAAHLNDRGIPAPRGGLWQSPQVMRLMNRLRL